MANVQKLLSHIDELITEGEKFLDDYPIEINYHHEETVQIREFRNAFDQWQHSSRSAVESRLSLHGDKNYDKNPLYESINGATTYPWEFQPPYTCLVAKPVNQILSSLKSLKRNLELATINFERNVQ